jgi:hypothetical protein
MRSLIRKRRTRPPRPRGTVWRFIRRHQLVELFIIIGAISLIWLGLSLDNAFSAGQQAPPKITLR